MFCYQKCALDFQKYDSIYEKLSNYRHMQLGLCVIKGYLQLKSNHIFEFPIRVFVYILIKIERLRFDSIKFQEK